MNVVKYNLSKPEKYKTKNGAEKTMWHNVGTLTEFIKDDGSVSKLIEIPAIGLKVSAFPAEPRPQAPTYTPPTAQPIYPKTPTTGQIEPQEEILVSDIPF